MLITHQSQARGHAVIHSGLHKTTLEADDSQNGPVKVLVKDGRPLNEAGKRLLKTYATEIGQVTENNQFKY